MRYVTLPRLRCVALCCVTLHYVTVTLRHVTRSVTSRCRFSGRVPGRGGAGSAARRRQVVTSKKWGWRMGWGCAGRQAPAENGIDLPPPGRRGPLGALAPVPRQRGYYNPSTLKKRKIDDFEMRSIEKNHFYVVIIHHRSA